MTEETEIETETIKIQLPSWLVSKIRLLCEQCIIRLLCEQCIFRNVSEFIAYAFRDDIELRRKYSKEMRCDDENNQY